MRLLFALGLLAAPCLADGTYRSRPDLAPPHLNISIPCDGRCEQGYLFVAAFAAYGEPDDRGSLQAGPYILTSTGDLVWSGFGYFAGWAGNLQAARWQDRDVLFSFEGVHNRFHGHGHGHHTLLGQHYEVLRELRAGGAMVSDKHEFRIENETTALIQIYHPLQMDLTAYGGEPEQTWIVDARFQELDIATGQVLFEWHSLDHASPYESALPLPRGLAGVGHNSTTAWDYFHINSIAKGRDGHYLVSARHASTILKINSTDGSVIWRLGGRFSDFTLADSDALFGFQHHARYLVESRSHEVLSLFDNAVYGSETAGDGHEVVVHPYSRGKHIALDHVARTATLVRAWDPPAEPILAKSQGSLQTLPGGGALVNWGSEGQLTEYDAYGQPVFHAFLGSGFLADQLQNYRAFRYNWTGFSPEPPALLAEQGLDGAVRIFVSWNGDTETQTWRFRWAEEDATSTELVRREKTAARRGFETAITVRSTEGFRITSVKAEAVDGKGRVLTVLEPVEVKLGRRTGEADRQATLGEL